MFFFACVNENQKRVIVLNWPNILQIGCHPDFRSDKVCIFFKFKRKTIEAENLFSNQTDEKKMQFNEIVAVETIPFIALEEWQGLKQIDAHKIVV